MLILKNYLDGKILHDTDWERRTNIPSIIALNQYHSEVLAGPIRQEK